MATLESLVATIAQVEAIGPERVRAIARSLREAGIITTRGRGKSAATMSDKDAANLLIAVNVADTAGTAPETVGPYRKLRAKMENEAVTEFGTELEYLIEAARTETMADYVDFFATHYWAVKPLHAWDRDGDRPYKIFIRFDKPVPYVMMHIEVPNDRAVLVAFRQSINDNRFPNSDGYHTITIGERTIYAIGELLRN